MTENNTHYLLKHIMGQGLREIYGGENVSIESRELDDNGKLLGCVDVIANKKGAYPVRVQIIHTNADDGTKMYVKVLEGKLNRHPKRIRRKCVRSAGFE